MTGLRLTIPTVFTDVSLPSLRNDPLLSVGSLLLVDATHPFRQWPAGVPAPGVMLPNIASQEAAALLGASTDAAIGATMYTSAAWVEGTGAGQNGISERTPKGGLHTVVSKLRGAAACYKQFRPGTAFAAYFAANATHDYYMGVWHKCTRMSAPFGPPQGYPQYTRFGAITGVSANLLSFMQGGVQPTPTDITPFQDEAAIAAINNQQCARAMCYNINNAATSPLVTPLAGDTWQLGPMWGNLGALQVEPSNWPSGVVYRWYLEDLTVSGRTYAQVSAIDKAEHTKQVMTVGGRYYGDTNIDPLTIP